MIVFLSDRSSVQPPRPPAPRYKDLSARRDIFQGSPPGGEIFPCGSLSLQRVSSFADIVYQIFASDKDSSVLLRTEDFENTRSSP